RARWLLRQQPRFHQGGDAHDEARSRLADRGSGCGCVRPRRQDRPGSFGRRGRWFGWFGRLGGSGGGAREGGGRGGAAAGVGGGGGCRVPSNRSWSTLSTRTSTC